MNATFKSRAMAGEYEQKEKTCSIVLRRRGVGSNLLLVSLYAAVFGLSRCGFCYPEILRDDPNVKYSPPVTF